MTQTLEDKISESENKHFQAGWQAALDFMKNREEKINNSVSGKEDVKLPEVRKKYKHKGTNNRNQQIVERVGFYNDRGDKNLVCIQYYLDHEGRQITAPNNAFFIKMEDFNETYEELPEDNIEIKPEWTKPLIVAVDEGKEGGDKTIYTVREGNKIVYCGEENPFPEENAKSIWKDVSELQEKDYFQCLVRLKDGEVAFAHYCFYDDVDEGEFLELVLQNDMNEGQAIDMDSIKSYCTLTDYINNTEERLRKLEGK